MTIEEPGGLIARSKQTSFTPESIHSHNAGRTAHLFCIDDSLALVIENWDGLFKPLLQRGDVITIQVESPALGKLKTNTSSDLITRLKDSLAKEGLALFEELISNYCLLNCLSTHFVYVDRKKRDWD